jgi:hypothetical protein
MSKRHGLVLSASALINITGMTISRAATPPYASAAPTITPGLAGASLSSSQVGARPQILARGRPHR